MRFQFRTSGMLCLVLLMCMGINSCGGRVQFPEGVTPPPAVFAYGDSIFDQGNNNALQTVAKANYPPYGKDFPGGLPTGRFCNGRTPPDLLAEELGIKDTVPAYLDPNLTEQDLLTGVSFASGAAGFDPITSETTFAISLPAQLEYLKEYKERVSAAVGPERASQIVNQSFHAVAAGSDDLMNNYFGLSGRNLQYDLSSYADLLVSAALAFVKDLYDIGARRIAIFGIPPIGCLPIHRTLGGGLARACNEEYNQAAELVNSKLSAVLDSFAQSFPQSSAVYVDIYNPLLNVIQNPQKFGFEVSDRGCCGTGVIEVILLCRYAGTCPDASKYLFWDSYHPTEKGYQVIVSQVLQSYITRFFR